MAAALAAGCGGESHDDAATGSSAAGGAGADESTPSHPSVERTGPPPSSKGGDNSIQQFGEAADPASSRALAGTVAAYLDAQAEGDWGAACALIAEGFAEQLAQLAEQAEGVELSCERYLRQTVRHLPAADRRALPDIRVGSVRIADDEGFVIFKDHEGKWRTMPMSREGDGWKVGAVAAAPLQV